MAVNFSNSHLGTRVLCSTVSTENHEPNNLISNDFVKRNRGFLADSFVRPPVDIILQFPCPITMCCLAINGRVGSQVTSSCEILVQKTKPEGFDPFNFGVFICIGRYSWNSDKKGVYATKTPHPEACKSFLEDGYSREKLKTSDHLAGVWSLRLRLSRTEGSSIPALGSCNLWGYVAYSNSPTTARRILSHWHSKILPKYSDPAEVKNEEQTLEASASKMSESDSSAPESCSFAIRKRYRRTDI